MTADILKKLYGKKSNDYYNNVNKDIIKIIPSDSRTILEIGCGQGATLIEIKKRNPGVNIYGIDIVDIELENKNKFSDFICGNIEDITIPYPKRFFDIIILADVIEHLIDPWSCINNLSHYLSDKGNIIATIPNILYHRVIRKLVFYGDFEYTKSGILDITHLRFFTKKTIIKLFKESGFNNILTYHIISTPKGKMINLLTFGFFNNFLTYKYIVQASL
jgi:2-polyprenyl-3-methyl-5-hydroxy-6-metoxy-1,4-benzoquinol methylase